MQLFDHCLAPDTMGDGTGCDNMTAVIAKLKPNAFSATADKKAAVTTAVASAADSTNSDLTEKSVKLPKAAETEVTAKVKRPAEDEPDHKERIPEPQAKKAKTDSDDNDTATEEKTSQEEKTTAKLPKEEAKEAEETKTKPETV